MLMKAFLIAYFAVLVFPFANAKAKDCSSHTTKSTTSSSVGQLENLHVDCSKEKLVNRFKLTRPSSKKMAYDYRCCKPPEMFNCFEKVTKVTSSGNVNYLDRQNVECDKSFVMRSFKLERSGGGYRYRMMCCAATPEHCVTEYTSWNYDGAGNVVNLDRHDVKCPNDGVIQQFRLESKKTKIRYKYKCCEASEECPNPFDKIDNVLTCDARYSTIPFNCKYEQKVGASYANTESSGQSETISKEASMALEKSFFKVGKSSKTQYDWSKASTGTFQAEKTTTASFECPPGIYCKMDQVVGFCGNSKYRVRANEFRLVTET